MSLIDYVHALHHQVHHCGDVECTENHGEPESDIKDHE